MEVLLLAGGLGTRLHPLTLKLPKPMVPVLNVPWLDRLISWLSRNGARKVVLATHHCPEAIVSHFEHHPPGNIEVIFCQEEEPLGTGGAIGNAAPHFENTFFVFNSDIVAFPPLREMLAFHLRERADVTIAVIRVPDPSAYGLVLTDGDGRVRGFVEKPDFPVPHSSVNAGIYVMEPAVASVIPRGRPVSVEREVFPSLIQEGYKVAAFPYTGYWVDVGTRERYLQVHWDGMSHKLPVSLQEVERSRGIWVGEGAVVSAEARLIPPLVIGKGAVVDKRAVLGPWVCLGAGVRVSEGAVVSRSVLWEGARVESGVTLVECVVGHRVRVEDSVASAMVA